MIIVPSAAAAAAAAAPAVTTAAAALWGLTFAVVAHASIPAGDEGTVLTTW
jgi:hypothetical protein